MDGQSGRREIVEAIRAQLERDNDRTRWCAVKALGRLAAREALPDFIAALGHDPDPDVRMEIAMVLGSLGEPDAVEALIGALHGDPDDDVRLQMCRALGQVPDSRATEALIDCLAVNDALGLVDWDTGDDIGFSVAWELQREALEGLARIGGDSAIEATIQLLSEEDDDDLQGLGLRILARIGGQRAIDFVIQQLQDGHQTARRQAAKALGQVLDERVILPLIAALEDQAADVRAAAGWSLLAKQEPDASRALINLLQDPEASVRSEAAAMVANFTDAEVVTPLIRLAYDSERAVQQRAIQALGARCETRASANLLALLTRSQDEEILANTLIEPLAELLQSACLAPTTRMQAVLALGDIAALEAPPAKVDPIEILTVLVGDQDIQVAQAALLALSRIGGDQATAALMNALRGDIPEPACASEEAEPALTFPTSTLEAIQAASTADAKREDDPLARQRRIRSYAARMLSDADLPQARALLCQAAQDEDPELRCEALSALGRGESGDDVITVVAQGVCDASCEVRIAALEALAHLQPDDATDILLERLAAEPDPLVRPQILEMLGRLGDRRAMASIITALDDDERYVQRAALEALASLGDRSATAAVRPFLFAHGGALWQEALAALQRLHDQEIAAYLLDSLRQPEQEEYHGIAVEALAELGVLISPTQQEV